MHTRALIRIEEMRQIEDKESCKAAKMLPLKNPIPIVNSNTITATLKLTTLD